MNEVEILGVAREGVLVMLKIASPILLTGLVVGLLIAVFQALTQIQEMTLTFVPKILAVFISLIFFLPFMMRELTELMDLLMDRVVSLG